MVFFRVLEVFPPFVVSLLVMEILFCNVVVGSSFTCDVNEHEALMEFAGNLSNSRAVLSDWFGLPNCCDWDGVFCEKFSESSNSSTAGNIVKLDLGGRGFSGTVSSSLGRLVRLRYLDLSYGSLRGTVPEEVMNLGELEFLDLSFNGFTGSFLGGLKSVQVINISSNSFDGSLVDSMMVVYPDLVFMNVSNNSFVGPIMSDICSRSPGVKVLDFSMNGFSGNVDRGFGNCSALIELSLGTNALVGELPDDLFMASSLEKLSLCANGFSGRLSGAIGNLTKLNTLIIYGNRFSGNLPDVFGNLTKLEQIDAHSNLFNGSLPASLSSCSLLQTLVLRNNSLTGNIDLNFSEMANLTSLDLASNHFSGNLPSSLSHCKKLQTLTIAKNRLSGEIPEELGELDSLIFLSLSNNSFTNISTTLHVLQNCRSLGTLILTRNFKGELLPEDVTGFNELKLLAVGNCGLFGGVPAWLLNCKKLQILDLSWNHLSGNVPPWIGELDELFYLDLSNNSLTGEIPMNLTQLKSLVSMKGSTKGNSSMIIPVFVKRNQSASGMQYNQISSFPPSIYLCNNMLNGTLSPEFGRLRDLHVLDFSRNNITGTIPDTLSEMINLEILDLSFNDLFGAIPVSLNKLTFLSKFSVAYNHLVGRIPTGGQLFSFASSSFEGNTGLCGGPLPPCNSTIIAPLVNVPNSRNGRNTILGITISLGAGIVLLLVVLLLKMSKKDVVNLADSEDMEIGYACSVTEDSGSKLVLLFQNPAGKELTIADILKATNNFDQANIIGCGGFGLVYKASLPDGTRVAIKRLSGDCGQMEREFRAEVEALSRAQHKNLVLLQGYCRHGDDRLLIYSYMENGSLDYWLHERLDSATTLDWEARLKIARGAAYGLAYLHKSCVPNVVHRDVKSSNILLNDRFEAHLADFGLSRLLKPYDTHVTTDLVGTLGYIPPEYSQTMTATFKGDVYSFGIVILELLTGKRPVDICKLKGCRDLVSWVRQMKSEMRDAEVFEPSIWNKENDKQLLEVLDVALKCVNVDPKQRPSIDQVVSWLDRVGNHDETLK